MAQIALPLGAGRGGPPRIVIGNANQRALEMLAHPQTWPFGTAVLSGPQRSGKSLIARWFFDSSLGDSIDDASRIDETELFHRWNRAQQTGRALLLVASSDQAPWRIALPDLASRVGAAAHLEIGEPDDAMIGDLIAVHAEQRGLALGPDAIAYLVPRTVRSHLGIESLVATIDRLSLERKAPPGPGLWREALEVLLGPSEPRLL